MTFDREAKCGIRRDVYDPETVALSVLDVDTSAYDLRAANVSSYAIDETRIRDLNDY